MTTAKRKRLISLLVLVACAAALVWFGRGTEIGRYWTDHANIRAFLARHPTSAPLIFVGVYSGFGLTMLPLWPLQTLAGYVFGPVTAIILCQTGNAIAAYVTTAFARWLARGLSLDRVGPLLARAVFFEHRLGSTGIPLVMGARLVHVIPFGPSNVVFGLLGVRPRDVAIGTLLGNVGSVSFYAILGSLGGGLAQEWGVLWKLVLGLVLLNGLMLAPLIVRYRRSRGVAAIQSDSSPGTPGVAG